MRCVAALAVALLALFVPCGAAGAQAAPHHLTVRVVTSVEGAPLGYSVVALPALGIERFTSASGAVVLPLAAPGPVRLVVKRLGFTPKDTTVTVTDAPTQSVTIALARVSFRLDAVRVVAWPPCRRPGLGRRSGSDPQSVAIIGQLRQNAERYRLLVRNHPFVYRARREFSRREPSGTETLERTDTVTIAGRPAWSYAPGTLVGRERRESGGPGEWIIRIPSIGDLASDAFVDNHCFHIAGLEEKEGRRLLRIDIVAAERLRGTDVNVVAWLDPADFQLRHATFTLTKPPPQFRHLLHLSSKVDYEELVPFVPVIRFMVAESLVQEAPGGRATRTLLERQTIEQVLFTGEPPT